jgi:thioredoxin-dependent peroxiredoxin
MRSSLFVLTYLLSSTLAFEITRRQAIVAPIAAALWAPQLVSANADPVPAAADMIGVKAPDFELPNSRGEGNTTLDQLVDSKKWTVLYFYPGAFTQGCTLEARNFQSDFEQYRQLNAQIVGISVDPPEKNAQFCSTEKLDFYMLSDTGGRVSKLYGSALSIPGFGTFSNRQTYLIDPKGNLRWVFKDVESRIPRHSAEVLEKLSELEGVNVMTA